MEDKLRKGTVCFIIQNNQVLLTLIEYPDGNKYWNGIGGYAEKGEALEDSVVREIQEETYIIVNKNRLKKVAELNISLNFQLRVVSNKFLHSQQEPTGSNFP